MKTIIPMLATVIISVFAPACDVALGDSTPDEFQYTCTFMSGCDEDVFYSRQVMEMTPEEAQDVTSEWTRACSELRDATNACSWFELCGVICAPRQ